MMPFIENMYEVVSGPFIGFVGRCVSYDLESDLPIILQDDFFNSVAVKQLEVRLLKNGEGDISNVQKN